MNAKRKAAKDPKLLVAQWVEFQYPAPTPNGNNVTISAEGFVVRLDTEQEDIQPVALVVDTGSGDLLLIRPEEVTAVLRQWYVEGGGWFVTATRTKARAHKEGVDEFGRGNVNVVRPATTEEVLRYRQATSRRTGTPRRVGVPPAYRHLPGQSMLITPQEAAVLLAGLVALERVNPKVVKSHGIGLRKRLKATQRGQTMSIDSPQERAALTNPKPNPTQ